MRSTKLQPETRGWFVLVVFTAFVAGVYLLEPGTTWFLPQCPFHMLTGLYCPGCGTFRSLRELLHGDVTGAFRYNSLAVLLLPIPFYDIVIRAVASVFGRTLRQIAIPPVLGRIIVVAIVVYWIARNVPVYPFYLLAPH